MISSLHIQRITVLASHWTGAQLVLNLISVGGCYWSKYSTFTLSDAWTAGASRARHEAASTGLATFKEFFLVKLSSL